MKPGYIIFLLLLFLSPPVFSQSADRAGITKGEEGNIEILLNSGEFFFKGRMALPSGGSSIDLTTHRSYVKFSHNEIESFMPFFGRAYSGIGFNDPGLHFEGKAESFVIEKKRRNYYVTAIVRTEHDHYRLFLTVSPDGNASLTISSNNREPMSYNGEVTAEVR